MQAEKAQEEITNEKLKLDQDSIEAEESIEFEDTESVPSDSAETESALTADVAHVFISSTYSLAEPMIATTKVLSRAVLLIDQVAGNCQRQPKTEDNNENDK